MLYMTKFAKTLHLQFEILVTHNLNVNKKDLEAMPGW